MKKKLIINLCAILLYCIIAAKIIYLQDVNTNESCDPDGVRECIKTCMRSLIVSSIFFLLFLYSKRRLFKTYFLMFTCIIFLDAWHSLLSITCGHESYGEIPFDIEIALLSFSLIFIFLDKYNILLSIIYIAFIIYIHIATIF